MGSQILDTGKVMQHHSVLKKLSNSVWQGYKMRVMRYQIEQVVPVDHGELLPYERALILWAQRNQID